MTLQGPKRSDGLSQLTELLREPQEYAPPPVDPRVRRRRRLRALIATGVVLLVVGGAAGGYVAAALGAPLPAGTVSATAPTAAAGPPAAIALSPEGASAMIVTGGDAYLGAGSDELRLAGGEDPRPIASISKLITALVVLDAHPLAGADDPGPTLTFDRADHALYDKYYVLNATIAAMPTGSSLSLHDALEAMLVASACNYAEAVAGWAFGSQAAFLAATRAWLSANGMTGTTMVEPTGIDARNTSTTRDLMTLARLAMANPAVAQIVAMPGLDVPGIDPVSNTNGLLGVDGITGLKTGTLDGSGANLLFSATLPVGIDRPLDVVGVVLGAFSRESMELDVRAMLASLRDGFHEVTVAEAGQAVGDYRTVWGGSAQLVLERGASLLTWSDAPVTVDLTTVDRVDGRAGEEVGSVTFTAGLESVTVPVVLDRTVEPPTDRWRLTHPGELFGG